MFFRVAYSYQVYIQWHDLLSRFSKETTSTYKMPRLLKIVARIIAVLAGIILLAWVSLSWYITSHKQALLQKITSDLSAQTGGKLVIEDMQPSLWTSFPNVSVVLSNVTLRDSMYEQHHHSLLEAKQLFVKLNTLSLLSGRTEIKKLTAAHGAIFIYTDSTGYSNTYLLSGHKKDKDTTKEGKHTIVKAFGMEDIDIQFVHEIKKKLFHVHVNSLNGTTELAKGVYQVHVGTKAHVYQFCFNTVRGSFIKDRDLDIDIALTFDPKEKKLYVPEQEIKISGQPIIFTSVFNFKDNPPSFSMRLRSQRIPYKTAVSWVSHNIRLKLDSFDFKRPIAVDAQISGVMAYRNIPLIRVNYLIKNNVLQSSFGNVENISFTGFYFNEAVAGNGHGDDNSQMQFQRVSGTWNEIPFSMDTLNVTNLLMPFLSVRVKSYFPLKAINNVVSGNTLSFNEGRAQADLEYVGGVLAQDTTPYTINGFLKISDAALSYAPRALDFRKVRATLLFKDDNLFMRDVHLQSKSSSISMEGEALHFLRLYFADPRKIYLDWRIKSPLINLNDFLSFVGKPNAPAKTKIPKPSPRVGGQLDNVLESSTIRLDAAVDKLVYKNFMATGLHAKASIGESGILLEQVSLGQGGGNIVVRGVIHQDVKDNPFELKADISKVNVGALFKGFDNFSQTALTDQNLQGRLTATAAISGKMTERAKILPYSLNGKITFRLEDGVLDHFAPLEKIGKVVFKQRNLSHVTFKDIHNTLDVSGNTITIPPMTIESSAVNMQVQGVYKMPKGTDIALSVPLRNPEKEEASTIFGKLLRTGKGIVVNLRAQDKDGTGVKITWDPFKKGKKATGQADEKP